MSEHRANGAEVTVWSVGKKAAPYFRYRGIEVAESFIGFVDRPEFSDARHVAAVVAAPFIAGEIDLIEMVSTRFISAGTQRVERMQLLPLPLPRSTKRPAPAEDAQLEGYTEFEPEPEKLLVELPPRPSRRRSSPRCSKGRRGSSRPSSGRWRPPPRTQTSWCAR